MLFLFSTIRKVLFFFYFLHSELTFILFFPSFPFLSFYLFFFSIVLLVLSPDTIVLVAVHLFLSLRLNIDLSLLSKYGNSGSVTEYT